MEFLPPTADHHWLRSDTYRLSTGREFYANCGLIGIGDQESGYQSNVFEISEGYDGHVDTDTWTMAEKVELADYMIAQWAKFKLAAQSST